MRSSYFSEIVEYKFHKFPNRYKWVENSNNIFKKALNNEVILQKLTTIKNTNLEHECDPVSLNNTLIATLTEAADASLSKTRDPTKLPHKKWINRECVKSKRELCKTARHLSNHIESDHMRQEYYDAKKRYKNLIDNRKRTFRSNLNDSIEDGNIIDWRNFKYLKQTYDEPQPFDNHDLSTFYEYFAKLYSKDDSLNNTEMNAETLINNRLLKSNIIFVDDIPDSLT